MDRDRIMRKTRSVVVAFMAASALAGDRDATPVLGMMIVAPASLSGGDLTITVTPAEGGSPAATIEVQPLKGAELVLPAGAYVVRVTDDHAWAAPKSVALTGRDDVVRLDVYAVATLRGRFVAHERPAPRAVMGRFHVHGDQSGWTSEIPCEIDGWSWLCDVPVATIDFAVIAPGYGSHYEWGLPVPAAGHVLRTPVLFR